MSPPLLCSSAKGSFDDVAVKDPSVIHHAGKWHVFYTARGTAGCSIGYVAAESLDGIGSAPRRQLRQLRGRSDPYAAAPQVFWFAPKQRWFLVFQTRDRNYQPVYSTTTTLEAPDSWSLATDLVAKEEEAKWIDFWVLCDDSASYLFYTRDHRDVYVMTAPLAEFPAGFGAPQCVFSPVHEAVHVYKVRGAEQYHLLYEQRETSDERRFGLAIAENPLGPWSNVTDAFATGKQLVYLEGVARWTDEVSHGEMLRSGYDQRMEYDSSKAEFLIQGLRHTEHTGPYAGLPWKLGILRKD